VTEQRDYGDESDYRADRADIDAIMRIATGLADSLAPPDPISELLSEDDPS
jgi:hypothetical protein